MAGLLHICKTFLTKQGSKSMGRIIRAKDAIIYRFGCMECDDAKTSTEWVVDKYGSTTCHRKAKVVRCPYDECPYFQQGKYNSFKEYLAAGEYKAQFEVKEGLDMNDLRGQPGDIRL